MEKHLKCSIKYFAVEEILRETIKSTIEPGGWITQAVTLHYSMCSLVTDRYTPICGDVTIKEVHFKKLAPVTWFGTCLCVNVDWLKLPCCCFRNCHQFQPYFWSANLFSQYYIVSTIDSSLVSFPVYAMLQRAWYLCINTVLEKEIRVI